MVAMQIGFAILHLLPLQTEREKVGEAEQNYKAMKGLRLCLREASAKQGATEDQSELLRSVS